MQRLDLMLNDFVCGEKSMRVCSQALSCKAVDNYYAIKTDCGVEVRIYFISPDIVRMRAGFDGDFKESSYSLVTTAWKSVTDAVLKDYRKVVAVAPSKLEDQGECFVISSESLVVKIAKDPYQISILSRSGEVLHRDCVDLALQEDSNKRRVHVSEIEPTDGFYGFGEKSGEFNKLEAVMTMSPTDAMGYNPQKTDSLYKHIPFYIKLSKVTGKACGYFYHSSCECDFDMGRRKSNYWHMHSSFRANSGDIDLFFINGPQVSKVVERYTDLTGKSIMLPKAALGYLGSSMYYAELDKDCDLAIETFINNAHEEMMPIDGFQLSSGYCTAQTSAGLKRCVFTWNEERFANPQAYFTRMDELGIVVSPNVKPGILCVHPQIQDMIDHDIFVKDEHEDKPAVGTWWGGKGYFADFTQEQTRSYWKQQLKDHLFAYGCYSIWNDNCEYDSLVNKDARIYVEGLGGTIGDYKSVMSNLMCHITIEALKEYFPNKRPFVVCRSGHAGIQRYAQTWSGDNLTCFEALKYNVGTMLGMSLSGVANQGSDIGGFYGIAPSEELFVRWVQNGIFQPRFSIHSVNTDNSVTEPWMYSSTKHLIRDAIKLRYRLSPYFYSLMVRAHETGLPYFSPMLMEFQHDPKVYDEQFNFMLGSALLVANVLEKGQSKRTVYFPKDEVFYDFKTCERYEGCQSVDFDVDLASIPMFIRSGQILPMAGHDLNNLQKDELKSLEVICAPDVDGSFTLYEDDGKSNDYLNGQYLKTYIKMTAGDLTKLDFTYEGKYQSSIADMKLKVIHKGKCPFYVNLQGQKLEHFLVRNQFEKATSGWYYSQSTQCVEIKYPNIKENYQVVISYEPFDMIGMQLLLPLKLMCLM